MKGRLGTATTTTTTITTTAVLLLIIIISPCTAHNTVSKRLCNKNNFKANYSRLNCRLTGFVLKLNSVRDLEVLRDFGVLFQSVKPSTLKPRSLID